LGIIVQKFGGTSVGNVERIRNTVDRIIEEKEKGHDVVVVVSAMGKTTDQLVGLQMNFLRILQNAKWICCFQPANR